MYEYLLSCIVFHEKEYKDKLCGAASYIEIYMICMCICVFFLSEVAIISKLYFNLLDRSFVLITIQFDIINFFLIYSNTILKNSMHIALTKSIFFFGQILWCYTSFEIHLERKIKMKFVTPEKLRRPIGRIHKTFRILNKQLGYLYINRAEKLEIF